MIKSDVQEGKFEKSIYLRDGFTAGRGSKKRPHFAARFSTPGEEGHAVLILFLCLPFLQPIPIPGLSTPLGFLVAVVALFLYLRRPPWLPKKFEDLKISSDVVIKISELAEKIWSYALKDCATSVGILA